MCGILGEFLFYGRSDIEVCLKNLDLLSHRGPDGFGFEYGDFLKGKYELIHNRGWEGDLKSVHPNYFMGHRRLSILDLDEKAFQPMESHDKRYSICFNGEIYNYLELWGELKKLGCVFRTDHSDTEVLLNGYSVWGARCLEKMRGMFAFAILDRQERLVFMARDRIGVKPLYYELSNERFAFCSELRALCTTATGMRPIDTNALYSYVALGYVPHPASIVRGIMKLPPASHATINLKERSIQIERYWDIDGSEDQIKSAEQLEEEVDALLTEAVSLRLRADVPVGAFVSGGVDSTLVVKKMRQVSQNPIEAFGADFPQPEQSERPYIEEVATRYSLNLNLSNIDLSHVGKSKQIMAVFDEPFDGGSSIAVFDLFGKAKTLCKVVLTGDGGDEMFAGYLHYGEFPARHRIYEGMKRGMIIPKILSLLSSSRLSSRKLQSLSNRLKGDVVSSFVLLNTPLEITELLNGSGAEIEPDRLPIFEEIRLRLKKRKFSVMKTLQYLELNTTLPGRMLYKVDRFSMYYGVEARSPFLDHKLVEKAFEIPGRLNVNKKSTKALLRKMLERDFSKDFVYRRKKGFGNPLSHWFQNAPSEQIFEGLLARTSPIYHYLDYGKVHKVFPEIKGRYEGAREKQIWRLLVLAQFLNDHKHIIG